MVLEWVVVFIDDRYIDPLIDSLKHGRTNKGLELLAFVVMPDRRGWCEKGFSHQLLGFSH